MEQARQVLARAGEHTLYARVDGVVRAGQLQLLELELVEPTLFFGFDASAADRFAELVVARLAEL